jgi:carbonic anhydrase
MKITKLLTRRDWLRALGASSVGGVLASVPGSAGAVECRSYPTLPDFVFPTQGDSPDNVLGKLLLGNRRYIDENTYTHARSAEQYIEGGTPISAGQAPAAMILSCADSRVIPELAFDMPRARLFVVRVAGNFATPEAIGSLEFGTIVLGSRFLMVMGHSNCGAVQRTIQEILRPGTLPPIVYQSLIPTIVVGIRSAVEQAIAKNPGLTEEQLLRPATEEVARVHAAKLAAQGPIIAPLVPDQLKVVAAYYNIDDGVVTIL